MSESVLVDVSVNNKALHGQSSRACANFGIVAPPGSTQLKFSIYGPEKDNINCHLTLDVPYWFDMNIAQVTNGSLIDAHSWSPVYFSSVKGATVPFSIQVIAVTPTPAPPVTNNALIHLIAQTNGPGYYVGTYPPTQGTGRHQLVSIRNSNLFPVEIFCHNPANPGTIDPNLNLIIPAASSTTNFAKIFGTNPVLLPVLLTASPYGIKFDPTLRPGFDLTLMYQ